MTKDTKTCLCCTKTLSSASFYSHRNPLINEKFGICKNCGKSFVDEEDLTTLYKFLQTMNIPYLKEFWKKALDSTSDTLGTFLKNLNSLKQNSKLEFVDSDDMTNKSSQAESLTDYSNFTITPAMLKRWGRSHDIEDYVQLEDTFERMGGYGDIDSIQESLLINVSKTQWMANVALEDGDHAKYEKMMNTLSKLMGDANIKPVQVKANAENGSKMKSWGEWVSLIEEKEPIDELDVSFKDKAFVQKYLDTFFFKQIKRVFGRATDEDVNDINKAKDGKL